MLRMHPPCCAAAAPSPTSLSLGSGAFLAELVFAGDTAVGWASLGSDPAELLRRALAATDA